MDSLTQIVLGAAVAEAALGKKIGNRAMLWGAIGGTIPDLDVLTGFWMNDLQRIEAHRGISHSLLFGLLFPLLMAWLVKRLYDGNFYRRPGYKLLVTILNVIFVSSILFAINFIWYKAADHVQIIVLSISVILLFVFVRWIWLKYYKDELRPVQASFKQWYWLFFLSIITHPILDCFTTYGTQLYLPFSRQRIAWNNISVLDPFYTVPFIICLIVALILAQGSRSRRIWNTIGLVISCSYMALTFVHKYKVDTEMVAQLTAQHIDYVSTFSSPTIVNNRLWHCIALTAGDTCYQAFYSLKDTRPNWLFTPVVRHKDLWDPNNLTKEHQVLRWFSQGYDAMVQEGDSIKWQDLRFASIDAKDLEKPFWVFSFDIIKKEGRTEVKESAPSFEGFGESWKRFMTRQAGL